MSSYGMCPYVLCILHSTRFWYKRRGFAVINIDIKPRSDSAGMAPVHPGGGQPVYRDKPGHFS